MVNVAIGNATNNNLPTRGNFADFRISVGDLGASYLLNAAAAIGNL